MIRLTEEQKQIQSLIHNFAQKEIKPKALELDKKGKDYFPWDIVRKGAGIGLLTNAIPEQYGGSASLDFATSTSRLVVAAAIVEELSWADAGVANIFGAHNLGLSPILASLDANLWEKYLPQIAKSTKDERPKLCAFAITEPNAGSDVEDNESAKYADLQTFAKKEGNHYVLNGRKIFISNGSVASIITVFAALDKKEGVNSWTCFVVTDDMPGFSVGQVFDKMGQRVCPAAELVFEDVKVPKENVVGGEGNGWHLNQMVLNTSRAFVGSIALGIARDAYERALSYARQRKQGGKYLIDHQMIAEKLADMLTKISAARTFVWNICEIVASQFPPPKKEPAMAKLFATDIAVEVCQSAIQILGGYGYMHEYGVEKCLRDARLCQIYEGTNEIQKLRIVEALKEEFNR